MQTEFKKGQPAINILPVGSVTIRIDKNRKQRAFVKTGDPNIWKLRAVVNWEDSHGPIPRGLVVHHLDRDTLNDQVENLQVLTRAAHLEEHRQENRKAMAF